ncbi:hypothetical protein TRFO_32967 [Tritrichomonas foetus]|uniref:E2F/DP family winged-helix DNA-binding domain-containing protein n=1 Tax=Tritrichomonas foetus TaxID=1144522 RepID=A0A1J4JS82_9EUKA|nr:hypothetical protein TRFO_32967 [Tritrichomonas foetus]|eukprot:OHT00380.1 hypothetical protein TRFO_32967 [Tritrichomonas foetus]
MQSFDYDESIMSISHLYSDDDTFNEYTGNFWNEIPVSQPRNEDPLFDIFPYAEESNFTEQPIFNEIPEYHVGNQQTFQETRNNLFNEKIPIDELKPHFIPFGLDKEQNSPDDELVSSKSTKTFNQHFIATHQIMYLFQRFNVLSMETCQQFCSIDSRRIYDIMNALECLRLIKKVPGGDKKTSNYQLVSDVKTDTPINISNLSYSLYNVNLNE